MLNIFKTKKINVPDGTKAIVAAQSWVVRWTSRPEHYGERQQAEFFTEQQDANDFADALKKAFKLTKTWGANEVTVKENI